MTHDELVRRACEWLAGENRAHAIVPELFTQAIGESPDVISWKVTRGIVSSTLIECKASRTDFKADFNKPFRRNPALGMGRYRWYFVPHGLVSPGEVPERWGLIWCLPRGIKKVKVAFPYTDDERNTLSETVLMVAALRRVCFPKPEFPPIHFVAGPAAPAVVKTNMGPCAPAFEEAFT